MWVFSLQVKTSMSQPEAPLTSCSDVRCYFHYVSIHQKKKKRQQTKHIKTKPHKNKRKIYSSVDPGTATNFLCITNAWIFLDHVNMIHVLIYYITVNWFTSHDINPEVNRKVQCLRGKVHFTSRMKSIV